MFLNKTKIFKNFSQNLSKNFFSKWKKNSQKKPLLKNENGKPIFQESKNLLESKKIDLKTKEKVIKENTKVEKNKLQIEENIENTKEEEPLQEELFSKNTWSSLNLNPKILTILKNNNFINLTITQDKCIPAFLKNDIIVESHTGSGKTLCYLIPILEILLKKKFDNHKPQCLVICPTRELACQVQKVLNLFSSLNITNQIIIGGVKKKKIASNILIVTPGRLLDQLENDCSNDIFNDVNLLVFDEAGNFKYNNYR
jgi:superfamily II DNA/RNA helicase